MEKNNINNTTHELPDSSHLISYIKGNASEEVAGSIEKWMAEDIENEQYVTSMAKIYFASVTAQRIKNRDSRYAYEKIKKKINRARNRKIYMRIGKISASVAAVVAFAFLINIFFYEGSILQPPYVTVHSHPGTRAGFQLPDGSQVWLNSNSNLSYNQSFTKKNRKVTVSGEALFQVVKDEKRPFIVTINEDEAGIEVLGTEFNVQAYPEKEYIKVTLAAGSVAFSAMDERNQFVTYVMSPDEQIIYNKRHRKVDLNRVNTQMITAWTENKLIFKRTLMKEVFEQIEHFYNVEIVVEDEAINESYFTGTFKNRQLNQVLKYIEIVLPIKFEYEDSNTDDSLTESKEKIKVRKTYIQ